MVRGGNNREGGEDNSVWGMLLDVYGQSGVKEMNVGLIVFTLDYMTYSQGKIIFKLDIEFRIKPKAEDFVFDIVVEKLRHQVKRGPVAHYGADIRRHIQPEPQPGVVPGRLSKMARFRDLGHRNFRSRDFLFIIQLHGITVLKFIFIYRVDPVYSVRGRKGKIPFGAVSDGELQCGDIDLIKRNIPEFRSIG